MESANVALGELSGFLSTTVKRQGPASVRVVVPEATAEHKTVQTAAKENRLSVEALAVGEFGAELRFFRA